MTSRYSALGNIGVLPQQLGYGAPVRATGHWQDGDVAGAGGGPFPRLASRSLPAETGDWSIDR